MGVLKYLRAYAPDVECSLTFHAVCRIAATRHDKAQHRARVPRHLHVRCNRCANSRYTAPRRAETLYHTGCCAQRRRDSHQTPSRTLLRTKARSHAGPIHGPCINTSQATRLQRNSCAQGSLTLRTWKHGHKMHTGRPDSPIGSRPTAASGAMGPHAEQHATPHQPWMLRPEAWLSCVDLAQTHRPRMRVRHAHHGARAQQAQPGFRAPGP